MSSDGVPENARPSKRKPGWALSQGDLIALNEEIAAMARAGLPLDQGLAALAREMRSGRLQRATEAIVEDLQAGRTLPEALERQSGRIPDYYGSLVAAGVRSGRVGEVLATLTFYARSMAELRAAVASALFYPAVVLAFAFALFLFVCWFVVPQFEDIFSDFGVQLPAVTRLALEIGRHPLRYVVIPPAIVLLGLVSVRLALAGTPYGRLAWARFLYSVPLVGTLIRSARLAAFVDLLAILVDYSLPLPEAIRLAGAASSDPLMAYAAAGLEESLNEGKKLGETLLERRLLPELVTWMVTLGERRGSLPSSLRQVAAVYKRQAEARAGMLSSVLPPLLIITTAGLCVGFFVIALFSPMITLITELS